jgi:hypothetical protein
VVTAPGTQRSRVATLLEYLIGQACSALADHDRPVCYCCLRHAAGVAPADFCDCGCDNPTGGQGSLLGRVVSIAPGTSPFGASSAVPTNCARADITATLELAVYRCALVMGSDGSPPDCDAQQAEAHGLVLDGAIIRTAVLCSVGTADETYGFRVQPGAWTPMGPAGGCAGGILQILASGVERVVITS